MAVAFSDVVSSTELWTTLGDARADDVRRRLRSASEEAVDAVGGVVVKDLGDGLMVTFPTASASIDGAVALQRAAAGVARSSGVTDLRIRVGVSIGEATRDGGDWFGVPVVEAARLCGAADPSQILVSDSVVLLARRSEHATRSLGPRSLKGLPDPVPTSEVEWSAAVASTVPLPWFLRRHADELAFVGRESAAARLEQALAQCGHRHLVFVSGEPGVGKTRLVAEFVEHAASDGATVVGSAFEQGGDQSWRVLFAGLRELTPDHEPPSSHRPLLATVIPGLAPATVAGAVEVEPFSIAEAVGAWLAAVAEGGPVVWVVDDLQWAAAPVLLVLRHLLPVLADSPVLVIGTYRDSDLDRSHPLAGWLADLRRHEPPQRIDLHGLSTEDTIAVLAARATEPLDASMLRLADEIHRETDGNAFFIGQVIDHLVETGALRLVDGQWAVTSEYERLGLPQGVREVVGRRLGQLPDGVDEVLSAAAVQGREFSLAVTCGALDVTVDRVADAFDAAERAGLIRAEAGVSGRYRFVHALVRQTLLDELSSLRRSRLHLSIASTLADRHASPTQEVALRIAGHFLDAAAVGGLPRAVDFLDRSDESGSSAVLDLAIRALADADDVGLDDRRRVLLHVMVAKSAWLARNDRELTDRSFAEAVRLADALDDPELFAEAVATGANAAGFGSSPEFSALAPRALAGIDPGSSAGIRLRAAMAFATMLYAPPGVDPAAEYLSLYDEADAVQRATLLVVGAGFALHSSPDVERAIRDHSLATSSVDLIAIWPLMRTDLDRADAYIVAMTPRADRSGLMGIAAGARQGLAVVALARGELNEVDALIQHVQDLAGDDPMYALGVPWQRGVLAHWRGEPDVMVSIWRQISPFNPYPRLGSAALGVALADLGDLGAAHAEFDAAYADGPASVGRDWTYTGTIGALAELAARLGREREAAELDTILEPFDGQFLLDTCIHLRGSVAWLRAGLAACTGNLEEAIERYRRAEEFEATQGAHALLARTRVDLADVLLRRANPGDDADAERLLTQAETEAARMGAGLIEQRARRIRERSQRRQ